jgi:hypothetical protein
MTSQVRAAADTTAAWVRARRTAWAEADQSDDARPILTVQEASDPEPVVVDEPPAEGKRGLFSRLAGKIKR